MIKQAGTQAGRQLWQVLLLSWLQSSRVRFGPGILMHFTLTHQAAYGRHGTPGLLPRAWLQLVDRTTGCRQGVHHAPAHELTRVHACPDACAPLIQFAMTSKNRHVRCAALQHPILLSSKPNLPFLTCATSCMSAPLNGVAAVHDALLGWARAMLLSTVHHAAHQIQGFSTQRSKRPAPPHTHTHGKCPNLIGGQSKVCTTQSL